jgi:hypothetical protein
VRDSRARGWGPWLGRQRAFAQPECHHDRQHQPSCQCAPSAPAQVADIQGHRRRRAWPLRGCWRRDPAPAWPRGTRLFPGRPGGTGPFKLQAPRGRPICQWALASLFSVQVRFAAGAFRSLMGLVALDSDSDFGREANLTWPYPGDSVNRRQLNLL